MTTAPRDEHHGLTAPSGPSGPFGRRGGRARTRRLLAAGLAGAAALTAAGCETISENTPDVGFTLLEPSQKPKPEAPDVIAEAIRRPVAEVGALELGKMRNGTLLTAHGAAPTMGWFQPALLPRGDGPSPDGFLEFDFVAAPPELNGGAAMPVGTPVQRSLRADRPILDSALAGVAGLRVYSATGVAAVRLAP
ncbi:hypothetical protein SAMN05444336_104277 [Albimonas donghaensis]|uniref:Uncharacterized protein n=1 Tax=Albimonas donghaensis TaxID=356660 RepID=A0A1H3AQ57_9RHOB|nr:hypothetical protein [Albimonas donghaensis]SDX31725.1 hypothetical protein SAMN05444336_104277 [Albimonas donghaensis]